MKNLRKNFPILSQYTYLNTASSGILYDSLLDYRQNHDLDFLIKGSIFRDDQVEFLNSVRQTVADYFTSSYENTMLVPNFSLGLRTILTGIPKNKKILLLEEDYPSINIAFTGQGYSVSYVQIDESLEENIEYAIKNEEPDVFAFSLVQYLDGIAIDLSYINHLKKTYPEILLIADGTQFLGTTNFNFSASGIDIVGCSGYKWLLGGYGNGFLLFQEGILSKLTPKEYSSESIKNKYPSSYTTPHARFECGHLDTFNFGSLKHSLQFLKKTGVLEIANKIQEVSAFAKENFIELNLLEPYVIKRTHHSSIFAIKGDQKLFDFLIENNIITSIRNNTIRISFHWYNTTEDVDILLSVLKRYAQLV